MSESSCCRSTRKRLKATHNLVINFKHRFQLHNRYTRKKRKKKKTRNAESISSLGARVTWPMSHPWSPSWFGAQAWGFWGQRELEGYDRKRAPTMVLGCILLSA